MQLLHVPFVAVLAACLLGKYFVGSKCDGAWQVAWLPGFPDPFLLMSSRGHSFWLHMIESVLDSWDHKDVRHSSGPEVSAMLLMHIELPRASLVACLCCLEFVSVRRLLFVSFDSRLDLFADSAHSVYICYFGLLICISLHFQGLNGAAKNWLATRPLGSVQRFAQNDKAEALLAEHVWRDLTWRWFIGENSVQSSGVPSSQSNQLEIERLGFLPNEIVDPLECLTKIRNCKKSHCHDRSDLGAALFVHHCQGSWK